MIERTKHSFPSPLIGVLVLLVFVGGLVYLVEKYDSRESSPTPGGFIQVLVPFSGVDVYLDGILVTTSSEGNQKLDIPIETAGVHSIALSSGAHFPWKKEVRVEDGIPLSFYPLLIEKPVKIDSIGGDDPEYERIHELISQESIPGASEKKVSEDGMISLWVEGDFVGVLWEGGEEDIPDYFCEALECIPARRVFSSKNPIRSVDFYNGRHDAFLIASGASVFAVEMDDRGSQNIFPLYSGENPMFIQTQAGNLLVSDGDALLEITL